MEHEPAAATQPAEATDVFSVRLDEFSGPFDLLLNLIAKHKLEVTELALHQVTDDYIGYIRAQGVDWDLDETTEFLVILKVRQTLASFQNSTFFTMGRNSNQEMGRACSCLVRWRRFL